MNQTQILYDEFQVTGVDTQGKPFNNVSRIEAQSQVHKLSLRLDYNSQIYNIPNGRKFALALTGIDNESLIPEYDYVMSGTIFQEDFKQPASLIIYASFGGLLMELIGAPSHLEGLTLDSDIYLHIKLI
ncbi:putative RNA polymerase [Blattamonas nauphoetae]|uniref:DNA-directed RNA polymerases I, II, and III subunit RPABC3 n=1 Tax=Blattamonas nauphoetae TaxID=2049346 RepID=A0ABQ9XHI3_9EUKA|nr:putative RNA polymerase [Blattamonas nauphoetae]